MFESYRGLLFDTGLALGLILAFVFYAPAYLVLAAARRLTGSGGDALRPALRLRFWRSGA